MTIHKLPVHVINQIAAGEVVERPAHMVKELVENSLDAGATEIEVAFDHGGRTVEITDNGSGISVDDLPLVFSRHATSKISGPDDLWKLQTFGFRGEALASISAVSSVRLISKIETQNAYRLDVNFGEILEPLEVSGQQGTRLVIESLFENVPARLKFLKSETAEASQIKNVLKSLAIAHPLVTFRLKQKNKLIEVWQKQTNALDRIRDLLGVDEIYSETLLDQGYRAEVYFASPHHVSKTSRQMWFFVNHRSIQDRTLQAASMDAFQGLLMHGEFPLCVVFVDIPEGLVDVNIHPTKSQVKFQDNSFVFRLVRRALRNGLERAPWLSQQIPNFKTMTPSLTKNPLESSQTPVWLTTQGPAQEFEFHGTSGLYGYGQESTADHE
jgi:DNA mismatch repair protein MutL